MASKPESEPEPVVIDGKTYTTVTEGLATILVEAKDKGKQEVQQVFYNPIQQFNRDLTVLAIRAYGEDALARRRELSKAKSSKKRKREAAEDTGGPFNKATKHGDEDGETVTAAADESTRPVEPEDGVTKLNDAAIANPPNATQGYLHFNESDAIDPQTTEDLGAPESGVLERREQTGGAAAATETQVLGSHTTRPPPGPRFNILDALSASGLRALRYGLELPFVTSITANDLSADAVKSIQRNVVHNKLEDKVEVTQGDANGFMMSLIAQDLMKRDFRGEPGRKHRFDVIDLDPYGTAAPFWDNALLLLKDGGLLCVTCTDSAIWAGTSYGEKCESLYGGLPVRGSYCHEAGLRLILGGIAAQAAKHGLAIDPLLSLSIDFYTRCFIRVSKSPAAVKFHANKKMTVYICDTGCGSFATQYAMKSVPLANKKGTGSFYKHTMSLGPPVDQKCEHCGSKMRLGGPMYGGHLHSTEFIQAILDSLPDADPGVYKTIPRIEGMLRTAQEEVFSPDLDAEKGLNPAEAHWARRDPTPFFFIPGQVASVLHSITPEEGLVRGALHHLGYQTARSHCKPASIKTDAPWSVIFRVIKEWSKQKAPIKTENIQPHMPAYRMLGLDKVESNTAEGAGSEAATPLGPRDSKAKAAAPTGLPDESLWETLIFDDRLKQLGKPKQDHYVNGKRLVRYQINPRENWGPMSKARKGV